MTRSIKWILALALVVAACGGSETAETTSSPGVETTVPAETTAAPSPTTTSAPADAVEAPELGDTSWNVTNYRLPDGTFTNVWKTDVTIAFSADGVVSGSAGCNGYEGSWSVSGAWDEFEDGVPDPNDGQEMSLDALSWTEIACEDADVMQQEAEILDLLQNAGRWVLIRGNFILRDAEGSFLFEAEPA